MTVTVRPIPKRAYQNGTRPFRPVVPANNIRPYTLKTWRPPVPEPLPPAPLLGPKELLGLGALVLAQIWGAVASRPAGNTSTPPAGTTQSDIAQPGPSPTGAYDVVVFYDLKGKTFGSSCGPTQNGRVLQGQVRLNGSTSSPQELRWDVVPASNDCDGSHAGKPNTYVLMQGILTVLWNSASPNGRSADYWEGDAPLYVPLLPGKLPEFPLSYPDGYVTPVPETAPATDKPEVPGAPKPLPLPLPLVPGTPREPLPEPSPTPATPGPAAPPAVQPRLPQRTLPPRIPGADATRDGVIQPQAPAPIAVTPGDAHFPVPGGAPVLGNGPQPKPETIAQELGRLEQKLARLSDPGPGGPGDGSDRLQLLSDLIGRLIEFATSMTSGGGYSLSSPCELDENGERIVSTVEYPGATNSLGVLGNKIDALAGVLQVHKNLKQPNCKQPAAVGQPVTVNFVQVD